MKIACHYAIPRPPHPELDAAVQDGLKLVSHIGGEVNFLYPGAKARRIIPRFLSGMHQIPYLKGLDRRVDLHHIFSNGIYPYPIVRLFSKPVVYTSVIELQDTFPPFTEMLLKDVARFVVLTKSDKEKMEQFGFRAEVILPGIDINRFSNTPCAVEDPFVLLAGSAPWNMAQFETKGVDALLQTAASLPWLRLVFLWRGKLLREMEKKVEHYGVTDQVTIIREAVDVNDVLKTVHAAVVLSETRKIVKAYPHSLLESLSAGKPVLISHSLAMADYVQRNGCGVSVESMDSAELKEKICRLRQNYRECTNTAATLDMSIFSVETMVSSYKKLYSDLLQ